MNIRKNFPLSIFACLLLTGCLTDAVSPSLGIARAPADIMQPRQTPDMLLKMQGTVEGAQGIDSLWLLMYASEAERYGLQLDACQSFIRALPGQGKGE